MTPAFLTRWQGYLVRAEVRLFRCRAAFWFARQRP
jgi:hypothetical protein